MAERIVAGTATLTMIANVVATKTSPVHHQKAANAAMKALEMISAKRITAGAVRPGLSAWEALAEEAEAAGEEGLYLQACSFSSR